MKKWRKRCMSVVLAGAMAFGISTTALAVGNRYSDPACSYVEYTPRGAIQTVWGGDGNEGFGIPIETYIKKHPGIALNVDALTGLRKSSPQYYYLSGNGSDLTVIAEPDVDFNILSDGNTRVIRGRAYGSGSAVNTGQATKSTVIWSGKTGMDGKVTIPCLLSAGPYTIEPVDGAAKTFRATTIQAPTEIGSLEVKLTDVASTKNEGTVPVVQTYTEKGNITFNMDGAGYKIAIINNNQGRDLEMGRATYGEGATMEILTTGEDGSARTSASYPRGDYTAKILSSPDGAQPAVTQANFRTTYNGAKLSADLFNDTANANNAPSAAYKLMPGWKNDSAAKSLLLARNSDKDTTQTVRDVIIDIGVANADFNIYDSGDSQYNTIRGKIYASEKDPRYHNIQPNQNAVVWSGKTGIDGTVRLKGVLEPGIYNISPVYGGKYSFRTLGFEVREDPSTMTETAIRDGVKLVDVRWVQVRETNLPGINAYAARKAGNVVINAGSEDLVVDIINANDDDIESARYTYGRGCVIERVATDATGKATSTVTLPDGAYIARVIASPNDPSLTGMQAKFNVQGQNTMLTQYSFDSAYVEDTVEIVPDHGMWPDQAYSPDTLPEPGEEQTAMPTMIPESSVQPAPSSGATDEEAAIPQTQMRQIADAHSYISGPVSANEGDTVQITVSTDVKGLSGTIQTKGLQLENAPSGNELLLLSDLGHEITFTATVTASEGEDVVFALLNPNESDGTQEYLVRMDPWAAIAGKATPSTQSDGTQEIAAAAQPATADLQQTGDETDAFAPYASWTKDDWNKANTEEKRQASLILMMKWAGNANTAEISQIPDSSLAIIDALTMGIQQWFDSEAQGDANTLSDLLSGI